MSGLWTPSGEGAGAGDVPAGPSDAAEQAAIEEEMRRVRAEIARTPAVDIVANHAIGLWQLAVLHLQPEAGQPLHAGEAAVAIDAMGGIIDALGDRLGEHAAPLRDALSQLRLAFVEVTRPAPDEGTP